MEVVMQVLAAKHVRIAWRAQLTDDLKDFSRPRVVSSTAGLNCLFKPFSVLNQQRAVQTMRKISLHSQAGVQSVLRTECSPRVHSSAQGSQQDRATGKAIWSHSSPSVLTWLKFLADSKMWVNVCLLLNRKRHMCKRIQRKEEWSLVINDHIWGLVRHLG